MLSFRLTQVANLINNTTTIADIGTDHAYLPIYLIKNNKAKLVYACDINQKPLKIANNNVKKFGLENQIFTILSDGLEFVKNKEILDIDYVTICGLGSQTILEILKKDHKKIKNYLICSNTSIKNLRLWAIKNNYLIKNEMFIFEDNRYYWLIEINKNKNSNKLNELELEFGEKQFFYKNNLYIDYLESEINNLTRILNQIDKNNPRYLQINNQINKIREYINVIR
ncbi:SAM-dependent methyltransferase [Mycoplasma feriruminatoris]|uniref:tRNA (adenine(22)-N(1))-methyltransferase n=1 Tax=Mycoplasma feriruminatoris TaxID=1179777 RepID=UPI00241DD948|nr:class I SAM-dependent methyltransferase [Mycoplasma feriruminatoris]WFQ96025.1 SAM-dependent methyltransferase [Mycoplasma feriruminatoris]